MPQLTVIPFLLNVLYIGIIFAIGISIIVVIRRKVIKNKKKKQENILKQKQTDEDIKKLKDKVDVNEF